MKTHRKEAGQTLIIVMLCMMTCLLGFVGLVTDVGAMFHTKRAVQSAVDSAAIAGAAELNNADVTVAAEADAAIDGLTSCTQTTASATVPAPVSPATCSMVVNNPPLNGPHTCAADSANCSQYVEVMATQNQPTTFMSLFGFNSMPVQARAVAYPGNGSAAGCIFGLDPNSKDTDISTHDHADTFSMPNCAMYADSTGKDAMTTGTGSISAKYVGVVGGYTGNVTMGTSGTPITGIAPVADPLLYLQSDEPTIPKTCNATSSGPLAPGYYCGISGSATLSPGLYIIGVNGISLNGNNSVTCPSCVEGTESGVTIFLTSNSAGISLGGNTSFGTGAIPLSAPVCSTTICSNGGYNDIVLWGAGTGGMSGQGNPSFNVDGVLYFPLGDITLWGSAGGGVANVAIVAWQIAFGGSVTINGLPLTTGLFPIKVSTLAE